LAKRGLYVYDWTHPAGPYTCVVAPSRAIHVGQASDTLQKLVSGSIVACFAREHEVNTVGNRK
jgi:hypothetical protein